MDDLHIIPATPDDADALIALQRLAFAPVAEQYGNPDIPPMVESVDQLRDAFATTVVLKAEADGRLVGAVRGRLDEAGICHIGRLIVRPDMHGRGIGTALMHAIEAHCAGARRFEIFTGHLSTRTIAIYERLGYREYARRPVGPGEVLVYMEKQVS